MKRKSTNSIYAGFLLEICMLVPYLLVLCTVLVVASDLAEPTISGKYFWFYMSMGLIPLSTLLVWIVYRKPFSFSPWDVLLGICCIGTLSVTYYRTGNILTTKCILLVLLLCFYFYSRIYISLHKRFIPILMLFVVSTGMIEAVWGLMQLYGFAVSQHSLFKITGSFFNPGPYAGYLAMVLPIALYGSINSSIYIGNSRIAVLLSKQLCRISFAIIILILPATLSRASWLAAVIGCLIVLYGECLNKNNRCYKFRPKQVIAGAGLVSLFVILALFGVYNLKKDSADGRLFMWKISLQTLINHPNGVGIGQFPHAYGEEQASYFASGKFSEVEHQLAGNPEYAFNEYLHLCIEWGVFPFILFMIVIIGSMIAGYKSKCWVALAPLFSLMVFALMSYPFSILPFGVIFVFLLSVIHSQVKKEPRVHENQCALYSLFSISTLVICICLYNRYPGYEAYKNWRFVQMYYNLNKHATVVKEYTAIYPSLNDRVLFLFEYARVLSHVNQFEESNRILAQATQISCDPMLYNIMGQNYQALKEYDKSEAAFMKASYLVPNRIYPQYLLAKLYMEMGREEKAILTAKAVIAKEPKVHSKAVDEIKNEMKELINNESR